MILLHFAVGTDRKVAPAHSVTNHAKKAQNREKSNSIGTWRNCCLHWYIDSMETTFSQIFSSPTPFSRRTRLKMLFGNASSFSC